MSVGTSIEWTDATWNPIAGCNDKSEGCRHCYARKLAARLARMERATNAKHPDRKPLTKYQGLTVLQGSHEVWTGAINFDEVALLAPLKRRMPTRYFVNSMSDLFHHNVTDEQIDRMYAVMALCPQHTFIVLTKRPERMQRYLAGWDVDGCDAAGSDGAMRIATEAGGFLSVNRSVDRRIAELIADAHEDTSIFDDTDEDDADEEPYTLKPIQWPLPNVWHLVSVEDQKSADERIPLLLQTPSAVRGVSCEPLLGPVEISGWLSPSFVVNTRDCEPMTDRTARLLDKMAKAAYKDAGGSLLDWVICGGESGAGARPMHPDWARGLRDQCQAAGVPFFFKQWGEWLPFDSVDDLPVSTPNGSRVALVKPDGRVIRPFTLLDAPGQRMARVGKKAAGHLLDGREWHQFPEVRA